MANLLEKASIILTPTAYSDGKMHSAKPIVSANPSVGDFDFARASVATRVNEQGLIEEVESGLPRIDYTDGSGSWLLEPTATNLVFLSDGGVYGSTPASETLTISPDGTNNAVIPTVNNTENRYRHYMTGGTYATNTLLTYSWYRKRISTPLVSSVVGDLDIKTLVNLTISEVTKQIESDINGFDRFQVVVQITDGSLASTFRAYFGDVIGVGNSSVAYFGHQYETGSYATSLINTSGTTQTRVADTATGSGSSTVINSSEGVFYAEISALADDGTNRRISLNDSSDNNRINFMYTSASNQIVCNYKSNGITRVSLNTSSYDTTLLNKIAFKWKQGDFSLWINGTEVAVDNNTITMMNSNSLVKLDFIDGSGSNPFYGKTKSVQVYTTALSDAELTSLTTI